MLDWLYYALGSVLSFFFNLIPIYGIAIILLTIFVRLILLPLTIKQTKSMQAMQKIQPHMKELQAKYKGDKARLNEEMMKLYKTHQVNPLGGCLPLVLQFPVFIGLFRVLNHCERFVRGTKKCAPGFLGTKFLPAGSALGAAIAADTAATRFLGMHMATSPRDALSSGPVAFLPYLGLLAAMGLTTWYQTKQAQGSQPPGAASQQMALVGKIMPAMLVFFSFSFPAGVSLYWVVSNIWTIGQQRLLLGALHPRTEAAPPSKGDGRGGRPPKGGPKDDQPGGGKAKPAPAPQGKGSQGKGAKADRAPASPNGGAGKPAKAPQNPKKPAAQGQGDGSAKAKGDGRPAPKGGSPQRRPQGGQARKRKRR